MKTDCPDCQARAVRHRRYRQAHADGIAFGALLCMFMLAAGMSVVLAIAVAVRLERRAASREPRAAYVEARTGRKPAAERGAE